jgi:hypothetical protein
MTIADRIFILDCCGNRLVVDQSSPPRKLGPDVSSDPIDDTVHRRGFVLMALANRVLVIELYPPAVAPLAALQALFEAKATRAQCIVLSYPGSALESAHYEFFFPPGAGLKKLERIVRTASRRQAAKLQGAIILPPTSDWVGMVRRAGVG